jgi:Short C-terminal domain
LSTSDLAAIGEFAMDRMAGSALAHETMTRYMRTRFGPHGEVEIHVALGRRIAGCGGRAPVGFGHMMALTGSMGIRDVPGQPKDLGNTHAVGWPGAMMGWRSERGDDDEGPSAGAMVGMMAVLIAAVALALFLLRPRRRRSDPVETLRRRLASGEISAEEYRERLQLLEGDPPS